MNRSLYLRPYPFSIMFSFDNARAASPTGECSMNRKQFDHTVRAAGAKLGTDQVLIIPGP